MNSTGQETPTETPDGFYVVAREPGAEHPALPTWANRRTNPGGLDHAPSTVVSRRNIVDVPGVFQLINVLSEGECRRLIELTEAVGYLPDAAVSLPRTIRHNDNVTWVVDEETVQRVWQRCAQGFDEQRHLHFGKHALGLNARFRFYRYQAGDYFKPHTDGSWFGSAVVDEQLIADAFGDRYSQLSFVLFLTDEFEGGRTEFYMDRDNPERPARELNAAKIVQVATQSGAAICFPHGLHPWHCLHSSETINHGVKYIIRTDVLFEI